MAETGGSFGLGYRHAGHGTVGLCVCMHADMTGLGGRMDGGDGSGGVGVWLNAWLGGV